MGAVEDGGGVAHGALLIDFAEAVTQRDEAALATLRLAIVAAMGEGALSDAAAVVGGFNGVPRIADATGIPLEDEKAERTASFRADLGIDAFDMANVS